MPKVTYEGRDYILKTVRYKCLKCRTFCETSKPYPDIAECECGNVRVDGGISIGANIYGSSLTMEDYSIYRTQQRPKRQLPQEVVTQRHERVRQIEIKSEM